MAGLRQQKIATYLDGGLKLPKGVKGLECPLGGRQRRDTRGAELEGVWDRGLSRRGQGREAHLSALPCEGQSDSPGSYSTCNVRGRELKF